MHAAWLLLFLLLNTAAAVANGPAHELCGITCFFNPLRHTSRNLNYYQARQWSKRQGLFLVVVELVFGEESLFEIEPDELTKVIQLRTSHVNVLWQKEALLNVALKNLPASPACANVVWLDSDVILEDGWMEATAEMLARQPIGQPFTKLVRLPKGIFSPHSYWSEIREKRMGMGFKEGQAQYAYRGDERTGHTGFAWAAQRQALEQVGFYDKAIVGGFDTLFVNALWNARCETRMNRAMQRDFERWANVARERWGNVSLLLPAPLPRTIRAAAFWHGELSARNYSNRHLLLLEHGYDPALHVRHGANGALEWNEALAPLALQSAVLDMFIARREDGQEEDCDEL